jgi:hypothetical protein
VFEPIRWIDRFGWRPYTEHERVATFTYYLPRWLWSLGRPLVAALIDEPLLQAVGFPSPPARLRRFAAGALLLKARVQRALPPRRDPYLFTRADYPSYPRGYEIEELGADRSAA